MKPHPSSHLPPFRPATWLRHSVARTKIRILLQLAPLPNGATVLLLAPSETTLHALHHIAPEANVHWQRTNTATTQLAADAHSVDAIICLAPLQQYPQWRALLADTPRALRHGGLLYVGTGLNLTFARAALRAHLSHYGYTRLAAWPPLSISGTLLGKLMTFSANRLSITQPDYD